ncbi:endonuclease SmrB [Thaumasiovibrio subtropicus]|uniref:endonuclease SmrB n=1 Tax=Thaumasiovibrio subtropicus TaxID=1891207 RepID=UPI000B35701C|nr:endonuclease SmrB [Thaumasiovibrio subtropicus]
MTRFNSDADDENAIFRDAMKGVKKIANDTITHDKRKPSDTSRSRKRQSLSIRERENHEFYFSDEFEPLLNEQGPMNYARHDVSKYEVKKLRRGVYVPDMFLDMHGMTQQEAKRELAAMLSACVKESVSCCCVMHGLGKHILKQKAPLWLAQHPAVMAFHQAPLEFGGDGALLVLIEIQDK